MTKATRKKLTFYLTLFVAAALVLVGLLYYRHQNQKSCISYYDKDGTTLLHQECVRKGGE